LLTASSTTDHDYPKTEPHRILTGGVHSQIETTCRA
jgi:hypothetical protein